MIKLVPLPPKYLTSTDHNLNTQLSYII